MWCIKLRRDVRKGNKLTIYSTIPKPNPHSSPYWCSHLRIGCYALNELWLNLRLLVVILSSLFISESDLLTATAINIRIIPQLSC